jgi:hypothetical protein
MLPRVMVSVPARFLALVDKLAEKNHESRSSLLGKVFLFELRDYAELYVLITRLTGDALVNRDQAQM